jgi:hypothetical protein
MRSPALLLSPQGIFTRSGAMADRTRNLPHGSLCCRLLAFFAVLISARRLPMIRVHHCTQYCRSDSPMELNISAPAKSEVDGVFQALISTCRSDCGIAPPERVRILEFMRLWYCGFTHRDCQCRRRIVGACRFKARWPVTSIHRDVARVSLLVGRADVDDARIC